MASDLLEPGLKLLFCGYNPSLRSGQTGYHYAHPGNRFWCVLVAAGITERLYAPEEDAWLLEAGIGYQPVSPFLQTALLPVSAPLISIWPPSTSTRSLSIL